MNVNDLDALIRPPTPTAAAALEVLRAAADPALVNHCLRSWAWAGAIATARGLRFDAELLYVAAMLHDLGVTPVFDSHTEPFEEAGGAVGRVFAAGAGWPPERRERVREVIVRHMLPSVDPAQDPEGHLLEVATTLDVRGAGADDLDRGFVRDVTRLLPRLGFSEVFDAAIAGQAARKPSSQAARLRAGGGVAEGGRFWAAFD